MKVLLSFLAAVSLAAATRAANLPPVQTVFVIVLENHDWSEFKGSASAPFLNGALLPMASHCEQYYNPPGLHPSEPNYLWLEAGTNFGIFDDNDPNINHQNTRLHLVTQLKDAGISWKTYQEDITGNQVPLTSINGYAPKHNPFVYFDDVTGTNNPYDAYGLAHIRPYTELAQDLAANTVARYNFISPNLCHDGHDTCAPQYNPVQQTDDWLAAEVPKILHSPAYSNNGALFITWDESETADGPIGLILLSPLARGGGYASQGHYTHSSLLRTLQEIFGVSPWLGDAAHATDLCDLFRHLTIQSIAPTTNGAFRMNVTGVPPGSTNYLEASTNLLAWKTIHTNCSPSNSFSIQDHAATNYANRFYRVRETP